MKTKDQVLSYQQVGMCEVGRIKHHLKHNLWNPKSTILFVGYQAPGTLGYSIVNGAKTVKIFGEEIAVNARIEYIEGYSGHADQEGLMNFIYSFITKPKHIFLVHGEEEAQDILKEKAASPVDSLDVAILQDELLAPILGIGDPRTDQRIKFVGGIRGIDELVKDVEKTKNAGVAFAMYPTSITELLNVADAHLLMPPKSTWFEPKLRSGLFIHKIER